MPAGIELTTSSRHCGDPKLAGQPPIRYVVTGDRHPQVVRERRERMLGKFWDSVMNSDQNPLLRLPKTLRFQLMVVLASMWSVIFCASVGIMIWLPGYLLVHVALLLLGIFGTGWIFRINKEV
jgi:hypothetical protein